MNNQPHDWKPAPKDTAKWICTKCGKLDFDETPDDNPTCGGSISERIADETNLRKYPKKCPTCGELKVEEIYCTKCGTWIPDEP